MTVSAFGKIAAWALGALLMSCAIGSGAAVAAELLKPAARAAQSAAGPDKTVKRQRLMDVDAAVLADQLLPTGSDQSLDRAQRSRLREGRVTLRLFDDVSIDLTRSSVEEGFDGGVVWTGSTAGGDFGILVIHNNRISGTVQAGRRHFLIDSVVGGSTHRVREIDTEAYPRDLHVTPPSRNKPAKSSIREPAPAPTTTVSYVTLMVAITAKARAKLGTTFADKIKVDVALVNQGLTNSRVPMRLRLVGITGVQAAYDERAAASASQPLYDITSGTSYNFAALRATRTSLAADLVTMYADRPEYCGIAWVNYPWLNGDYGFSVINSACQGGLTLAHELGHNMGLFHDRYVEAAAPDSLYNFGYVNIAGAFRTIMSYSNQCADAGISCTRITFFSNPRVTYAGFPVGIAAGQPGAADATRLLKTNGPGVAAFR